MDADLEIDALGLLCPLPVLRLRKRLAGQPSGAVVRLLADDPAAAIDVPHFCNEAGHAYLGAEAIGDGGPAQAYLLRVK
jgi:tRNA 2-thiouridine synthesizing protein A